MNLFTHPRVLISAAGLTLAVTLAACGGADTTAATGGGGATSATTTAAMTTDMMSTDQMTTEASATSGSVADTTHNDADMLFVQQMIPHHQGAIMMAALAPDRASSQAVKDLAGRIEAAQQPEIDQMETWSDAWGASMGSGMDMGGTTAPHAGSSHAMPMGSMSMDGMSMDGMMSDTDMAALSAATGADFDRLFLEQMIVHHQGAVEMADVEIGSGANPAALALAESIRSGQTAEIAEMERLLADI